MAQDEDLEGNPDLPYVCPYCDRTYEYNACQDVLVGCWEREGVIAGRGGGSACFCVSVVRWPGCLC